MDRIFLEGLQVRCLIGVNEWERCVPQTLEIALEFAADVRAAAATDDLEDATDYDCVARAVVALAQGSSFQLLESLAEAIAGLCTGELGISWVRVRVEKPGAVRAARAVAVEIVRER